MFKKLFGKENKTITILAPVNGTVVPASEINDPTFGEQLLGTTIGIRPSSNQVVAPASGTVNSIFDTGHALTMVTDDGVELIIHIGLDTVQLEGQFFTIHAKANSKVKPGDLLIEFDREAIEQAGYDTITPVILCNSAEFKEIETITGQEVTALEQIITLKKQ